MLKYAIIGFGGLGKTHFRAHYEVEEKACVPVKLVALCDIREQMFREQSASNLGDNTVDLDLSEYRLYTDVDGLLEKEELDFVVTALPTYLHEEIAVKIMKKGIHVFSEKPMAITYEKAENMIKTAKEMNVKLMIGQCCRYMPKYQYVKELVDTEKYGKLLRADLYRLCATPMGWEGWFRDGEKSGGAALDLHVHDVDMINYLLGMPKSVTSFATNYKTTHDSIVTSYEYDGKVVTATGEWGFANTYGFKSGLTAKFEKATVEWGAGNPTLTVFTDEEKIPVELENANSYALEVIDFIDCVANDKTSAVNPAESTLDTVKIAFAEKRSADNNGQRVELK